MKEGEERTESESSKQTMDLLLMSLQYLEAEQQKDKQTNKSRPPNNTVAHLHKHHNGYQPTSPNILLIIIIIIKTNKKTIISTQYG